MKKDILITQYSSIPWEVFTIDNLFTDQEIDIWIDYIQSKNKSDLRCFSNDVSFKNGKERNPSFSIKWWDRLESLLPEIYIDRNHQKWQYDGVIDYIMFSQIEKDQLFNIHTDTGCIYNPSQSRYSKYTILTYLNENFLGGCTRFYNDNFEIQFEIIPKKGRTLLFDISLFHEGLPIEEGVKYWMGTELVCSHK